MAAWRYGLNLAAYKYMHMIFSEVLELFNQCCKGLASSADIKHASVWKQNLV